MWVRGVSEKILNIEFDFVDSGDIWVDFWSLKACFFVLWKGEFGKYPPRKFCKMAIDFVAPDDIEWHFAFQIFSILPSSN